MCNYGLRLGSLLTSNKYASKLGDGVTLSEAKDRCQKHAPFLLAHFPKDVFVTSSEGDQLCRWSATLFYQWLTAQNEGLCKKLADAAKKKPVEPDSVAGQQNIEPESRGNAKGLSPAPAEESNRSKRSGERATRLSQEADVEMTDAPTASTTQKPQRVQTPIYPPLPVSSRPAPVAAPRVAIAPAPSTPVLQKVDDGAPLDPIQSFLELLEEILEEVHGDPKRVAHSTVHSKMYMKCSTQYGACKEVSQYYAKQLAASLPSKWYSSPYFAWLKEERDKPWTPESGLTADTVALQLKRRKKMDRGKPRAAGSNHISTPPTHMGKRLPATPRTGGLTLKRIKPKYSDDEDNDDGRPSKYSKAASDFDSQDEDDSEDEGINDSSDDAPAILHPYSTTPIPLPKIPKETVPIVVRAEKVPTLSPAGPNGTWRCEEDGCDHMVRAAEEPEGKRLIEKHFQEHANRVEKLNLALAEGTRGHLPIKSVPLIFSTAMVLSLFCASKSCEFFLVIMFCPRVTSLIFVSLF